MDTVNYKNTQLMECAGKNSITECQTLINIDDVNSTNIYGNTPLMFAMCNCNQEDKYNICQLLLENNADPNISNIFGCCPLIYEICQLIHNIYTYITRHGYESEMCEGDDYHFEACKEMENIYKSCMIPLPKYKLQTDSEVLENISHNIRIMELLLAYGADPNMKSNIRLDDDGKTKGKMVWFAKTDGYYHYGKHIGKKDIHKDSAFEILRGIKYLYTNEKLFYEKRDEIMSLFSIDCK